MPLLDRLGGVLTAFGSRRTKNEIKKKTRTRSQMSRHIFERFTTGMIQKDNLHIVVPLVLRFSVDNSRIPYHGLGFCLCAVERENIVYLIICLKLQTMM